jgi:hypothetical protein
MFSYFSKNNPAVSLGQVINFRLVVDDDGDVFSGMPEHGVLENKNRRPFKITAKAIELEGCGWGGYYVRKAVVTAIEVSA